jgi:hypothetical protein
MCCTRKSKVGKNKRVKEKSNAPGTCKWCLQNIGGRKRNPKKIAAAMRDHLEICSAYLQVLDLDDSTYICKNCQLPIEIEGDPRFSTEAQLGICPNCLPSVRVTELTFVSA